MAQDQNLVAERLSLFTLTFNTTWNFCYFNMFLRYALTSLSYQWLALVAFTYFLITFVFELRLLLVCWKQQNIAIFQQGDIAVRRALVIFYIKFYVIAILGFIFIDTIIYSKPLLLCLNLPIWVPQIYKNFMKRSRNTPRIQFALGLTITQAFLPLYIRTFSSNILEVEPSYIFSGIFFGFHALQIFILYL